MDEKEEEKEKKSVPPPTIKDTPPAKPPTTTADAAPAPEKKDEESEKEEESTDEIVAESENETGAEADLGNRIIGGLIDGIFSGALVWIAVFILPSFADGMARFLGIAYMLTRDSLPFLDGQSIGKKVVGTKAVREDGSSLAGDFKTGAIRNVWMLISIVELIVLIIRKDKPEAGRRLGDDFAKTKVINVG